MKKRLITMLLALLMVMGLLPTAAFAASTPEEALGEIDIYSGGEELSYLSINGGSGLSSIPIIIMTMGVA